MGCAKDKIISLFKSNTAINSSKSMRLKNSYGGGKKLIKLKKEFEDNITENIRNLLTLKK